MKNSIDSLRRKNDNNMSSTGHSGMDDNSSNIMRDPVVNDNGTTTITINGDGETTTQEINNNIVEAAATTTATIRRSDPSQKEDNNNIEKPWPVEVHTNTIIEYIIDIYARWTFAYMNPILRKGKQQFKSNQHLVQDDLYDVPDYMKSKILCERFWEIYKEKKTVFSSMFKLAAPALIPAGFWEFIYLICRVTLPLSLRYLLLVLEDHAGDSEQILQKGYPYAISLSVAAFLSALSQSRTVFLSTQSGIMLRGALTTAIYEHALGLTPQGRQGLTAGQITNLVAVDTQKLYDVMIEFHNIWSCPVMIIVVSTLLWTILGPELVTGVALLILVVPIVKQIVQKMLKIRKERSKLTDLRINMLTVMLQGIRVTKLNHYESKVEENVNAIRNQEMKLLQRELRMWAYVLSFAIASPLAAFGVAVSFYALVDEKNIITPSNAFSALLLFSILRFPINLTARLIGKMAQAADASKRISEFLERESYKRTDDNNNNNNNNKDSSLLLLDDDLDRSRKNSDDDDDIDTPIIQIKNGSFAVKPYKDGLDFLCATTTTAAVSTGCSGGSQSDSDVDDDSSAQSYPPFTLHNFSLEAKKSEVIAVVGPVGSGKTMLLRALLGEIPSLPSTEQMELKGRVAYTAQQPFIINESLRENILFGSDFNEHLYDKAIEACCLRPDIARLGEAEDFTQIGERGVTLSGGQKARVALARSLYANPDVALLDDVFSALDANTANNVFEGLFGATAGDPGMLQTSATVLVTHALHFLSRVDRILVIKDGAPSFCGTWSELQQNDCLSKDLIDSAHMCIETEEDAKKRRSTFRQRVNGLTEKDGFIMTKEDREYGVASLSVWLLWFKHAGGWPFMSSQILFIIFDRGFYIISDWWIAFWSESAYEGKTLFGVDFPPQIEGHSAQVKFVTIYAVIIVLSAAAAAIRSVWALNGGARCAKFMFEIMLSRVLRAPMSYFDTTPLGRVLNRFTHDVEVLDIELSVSMTGLLMSFSWLMSSVLVMVTILPWLFFAVIPISVAYFLIQLYYRMSGPDLQRLDAVSRSPIQASLAEGLEGAITIKAFRKERVFSEKFGIYVNRNCAAMLNFIAAQRWLGLRIELLGATVTLIVSTTIVCANGSLNVPTGLVGLLILWAVIFTAALNFFFLRFTDSEARMTSIERIQRTSELQQEASWETDPSLNLKSSWPEEGELVFDSVCMRYRNDLPLVLECVSFHLTPCTRCGVVGRTGSGKTSLTASLFRLVEIETGSISLDGVDLSKIGLSDVRGRINGIRVIPQDPVLFAGTVRDCIDPFETESDEKILDALQAIDFQGSRHRGLEILQDPVEEGGSNFSVGERQLLCLCRAIVEEPRVLVLDEATASVDNETDAAIQTMLRTRFRNTTMLTVAHRLHTIIDYDVVLVMEDGRVAEFGPPHDLLKNENGAFSALVDATGNEGSAELRRIAMESAKMNK